MTHLLLPLARCRAAGARPLLWATLAVGTALLATPGHTTTHAATRSDTSAAGAADLSLEELMKISVQTASRKTEKLQDVAAAVFVVTRDDIERSGASSIPEALRLAPGVQVARSANNRWAVSARGFNGRFANKLLVLMDGRSIYSPLFAGVLWENEDTLLQDIERIEIIRGPGAALWGANAVNGVINIITRKATQSAGRDSSSLLVLSAGSEEPGLVALRKGWAVGDGAVRVWAKAFNRGPAVDAKGNKGNDYWRSVRAGVRGDWQLAGGNQLTLVGGGHQSPSGDVWNLASLTSPTGYTPTTLQQDNSGAHLQLRHTWALAGGGEAALQGYADTTGLDVGGVVRERRNTADLDFQHRLQPGGTHDVVWGWGMRQSSDHITRTSVSSFLTLMPERRTWRLFSAFVQDEITLVPETWRVVLGARLEHNSFTGTEPQPNARVVWTPTPQVSLWGALSRAVRTPSRAERDSLVDLSVIPAQPPQQPAVLLRTGAVNNNFDSEKVDALEVGWRQRLAPQLSADLALFSSRYRDLRSGRLGASSFEFTPVPHAVQRIVSGNYARANTHGAELALDWQPSRAWRTQAAYTYTQITARATIDDPIATDAARSYQHSAPRHQVNLRTSHNPSSSHQLDAMLRHVSKLPSTDLSRATVPAYTNLDLRWAWRVQSGLQLAITGQGLLQRQHQEFVPDQLPSQPLLVQRAVLAQLKWDF
jgi:iron complex outermembrane recepter protein